MVLKNKLDLIWFEPSLTSDTGSALDILLQAIRCTYQQLSSFFRDHTSAVSHCRLSPLSFPAFHTQRMVPLANGRAALLQVWL